MERKPGRPKAAVNKNNQTIRAFIEKCFDDIGGSSAFAEWAAEHRSQFYPLWARLVVLEGYEQKMESAADELQKAYDKAKEAEEALVRERMARLKALK